MKLFSILKKDLLILLRDWVDLAVLFLLPLAFILPISFALGAGDGYRIQSSNQMIPLPVADYDQGPGAQALMASIGESLKLEIAYGADRIQSLGLQEDEDCVQPDLETPVDNPACVEKVASALLQQSERPAVLVISNEFSNAVAAGEPVQIILLYDPAGDPIQIQQIQDVVKGAAAKISLKNQVNGGMEELINLAALAPQDVRAAVENQASQPPSKNQSPAISFKKTLPNEYQPVATPDTYQQTVPGYTIMFVFLMVIAMSGSIHQERQVGTFRRLLRSPVSQAELLGGKLLASMLVGLAQVLLLFAVGVILFKLDLGSDPLAFFLLTIALVAAATCFGLAASTTRLRGSSLVAPLVIAALLGGCLFPLDRMPPILRWLSYLVPHSWALTGYQNLMVRGQGLQEVFLQIVVLAGFAALFFWIAVRRFRFETD